MAPFGRNQGRLDTEQVRALGHPIRIRIVGLFTKDTDRPLAADAVTAALAVEASDLGHLSISQVTYHLARLKDAQLLPAG